jgi:hypothetical protein
MLKNVARLALFLLLLVASTADKAASQSEDLSALNRRVRGSFTERVGTARPSPSFNGRWRSPNVSVGPITPM